MFLIFRNEREIFLIKIKCEIFYEDIEADEGYDKEAEEQGFSDNP